LSFISVVKLLSKTFGWILQERSGLWIEVCIVVYNTVHSKYNTTTYLKAPKDETSGCIIYIYKSHYFLITQTIVMIAAILNFSESFFFV